MGDPRIGRDAYGAHITARRLRRLGRLSGTASVGGFVREPSYDTIFVADPESGKIEQKTALPMPVPRFRFSPAGDRLAIASGGALWVMNPDGSDAKQLVSDVYNIAWSPDGAWIAYVRGPRPKELHIVGADGSGDVIVPGATPDGWDGLAWSPDGRLIALNRLMYFHTADQEQNLRLTNVAKGDGWRITTGGTGDVRASWSPNGGQIAFLRFNGNSNDVYVVKYDGTGLRQITNTPEREEEPQFWRRR